MTALPKRLIPWMEKVVPSGTVVGTSDTQTLTNKTLTTPTIGNFSNAGHNHSNAANGGQVTETALSLSDITTANASTSAHGLLLKLGGGTSNFLRADGTWNAPAGGGYSPIMTGKRGDRSGNLSTTSTSMVDLTAATTTFTTTSGRGYEMTMSFVTWHGSASGIHKMILLMNEAEQTRREWFVAGAGDRLAGALHHVLAGNGAAMNFRVQWSTNVGTLNIGNAADPGDWNMSVKEGGG